MWSTEGKKTLVLQKSVSTQSKQRFPRVKLHGIDAQKYQGLMGLPYLNMTSGILKGLFKCAAIIQHFGCLIFVWPKHLRTPELQEEGNHLLGHPRLGIMTADVLLLTDRSSSLHVTHDLGKYTALVFFVKRQRAGKHTARHVLTGAERTPP